MATGGMRVLIVLPVFLALLIVGILQIRDDAALTRFIGTQPDQVVYMFLNALNRNDIDAAESLIDYSMPKSDLITIAAQMRQNFGAVVISSTEIGEITPDHALIWSDTYTTSDMRYVVDWPLERRQDQWLISSFASLQNMLTDWHGI